MKNHRPSWMTGTKESDWPEDFSHENGNYFNKCFDCNCDFVGHKRRNVCRKCHYKAKSKFENMTSEERKVIEEKVARAIENFYNNPKQEFPHDGFNHSKKNAK